jgi:phage FluMu protein Com
MATDLEFSCNECHRVFWVDADVEEVPAGVEAGHFIERKCPVCEALTWWELAEDETAATDDSSQKRRTA